MTMQHTAVGLMLCTGAVLAAVALNFLTQRFAGGADFTDRCTCIILAHEAGPGWSGRD